MENPLHMLKSYFSCQYLAKFHPDPPQKKTLAVAVLQSAATSVHLGGSA